MKNSIVVHFCEFLILSGLIEDSWILISASTFNLGQRVFW